jgi:hypothetical protein
MSGRLRLWSQTTWCSASESSAVWDESNFAIAGVRFVVACRYRETGVLMYRGYTMQQFADQCASLACRPCGRSIGR